MEQAGGGPTEQQKQQILDHFRQLTGEARALSQRCEAGRCGEASIARVVDFG
jgi:hypothetical protein